MTETLAKRTALLDTGAFATPSGQLDLARVRRALERVRVAEIQWGAEHWLGEGPEEPETITLTLLAQGPDARLVAGAPLVLAERLLDALERAQALGALDPPP